MPTPRGQPDRAAMNAPRYETTPAEADFDLGNRLKPVWPKV